MSEINKKRIAVLVSGSGTNLQSIIDNVENGNKKWYKNRLHNCW